MIFISYSWIDQKAARFVETTIARMGISYWIDRNDLDLRTCLKPQIFTAIEKSSLVLNITSEASNQSLWVGFEREIASVLGKKTLLFDANQKYQTPFIEKLVSSNMLGSQIDKFTVARTLPLNLGNVSICNAI